MNQQFSWSANIGRWFGIPVRLHYCLFVFIAIIFCLQWLHHNAEPGHLNSTALTTSIVLVISILIHEMAHIFAAANLGGAVRHVVLTPWGGDSAIELPMTKRSQAIVYLAGPFANLMICLCGLILLVQAGKATVFEVLNPLDPQVLTPSIWEVSLVRIVTWVNFQLVLVNMIPAHPFDSSHLIRNLLGYRNANASREKTETAVLIIGHFSAAMLLLCAWFTRDVNFEVLQPTWFFFLIGGITLFFSSRYGYYLHCQAIREDNEWDDLVDELEDDYLDEEEYGGYDYEDAESISQWLQEKQVAREQIEREIEAEEERRVDSILEKLHVQGIEKLNDEEKMLLHRVSDRYRKRNGSPEAS